MDIYIFQNYFLNCMSIHLSVIRKHLLKIKTILGTSLIVQWLSIRLPVWGTWVPSLVREDSTGRGTVKPVYHSY